MALSTSSLDEDAYNENPSIFSTLGNILSATPLLVFFAFVCYALFVSNTTDVQDACGPQLWKLILAHLVVPIGLFLMIVLGTVAVILCVFGFSDTAEGNLPIVFGVVSALLLCMYCSLFLGFGYPIVRDAMYSETCVKALSHVSFTNTPLLGILGCIYLVSDVFVLSMLVLLLLFAVYLFCTSAPSNSNSSRTNRFNRPDYIRRTPTTKQTDSEDSPFI